MKDKDTRYIEATTRNLFNAERNAKKYIGKMLWEAKLMLGIKDSDDSYDSRVIKLCKPKA